MFVTYAAFSWKYTERLNIIHMNFPIKSAEIVFCRTTMYVNYVKLGAI
jgi:hypothetical protein